MHALHNIYQHSEAYGSVNMYSRIQEIIINSSFPTACLYPYACVVRLPWAECVSKSNVHALACRVCVRVLACSVPFLYRWYRGHNASDQEVIPPGNPSRRSTRCKTAGCSPQRDTPTNPTLNQSNKDETLSPMALAPSETDLFWSFLKGPWMRSSASSASPLTSGPPAPRRKPPPPRTSRSSRGRRACSGQPGS